jgi:hypothetical protein
MTGSGKIKKFVLRDEGEKILGSRRPVKQTNGAD